jgi:hypothetical protein
VVQVVQVVVVVEEVASSAPWHRSESEIKLKTCVCVYTQYTYMCATCRM